MEELVEVSRCASLSEARSQALVLVAVGIACQVAEGADGARLYVHPEAAERAKWELQSYQEENRRAPLMSRAERIGLLPGKRGTAPAADRPEVQTVRDEAAAVLPSPPVLGTLGYALVLLAGFGAQARRPWGLDWTELGAVQAGAVLAGELWRTATALTLHGDLEHLLGNLVFGGVCGLLVAGQFGTGVAWLAIVLAGTLGNLLNALLQDPGHAAVGASTAVFGGLGFLAGAAQSARELRWRQGLRRWAPVAAGVMLLAFLGVGGPRTDVGAHLAGFAVGVGLGYAGAHVPPALRDRPRVQAGSAAGALGLLALAWLWALG